MNFKNAINLYQVAKNFQEISRSYKFDKIYMSRYSEIHNNEIKNENNLPSIKNKKYLEKKIIVYKSKIITNIELSIELLYKTFFSDNENNVFYKKKLFFSLVLELIKSGIKIKEFYSLYKIGIPFYAEENNFYSYYLGVDKETYIQNILDNENSNNYILPIKGNLFIPLEKNNESSSINKFANELIEEENKTVLTNSKIKKLHFFGEILYLLRPSIYLALLAIFRENKIIPLIFNITIDILIYFSRIEINHSNFSEYGLSFLVQKLHYFEMRFRNKSFSIYLFREPIFSTFVRPLLLKVLTILHMPGFIKNIVIELLDYYTNYIYIA